MPHDLVDICVSYDTFQEKMENKLKLVEILKDVVGPVVSLAKAAAPGKENAPTLSAFKPDCTTVGLGGTSFDGLA